MFAILETFLGFLKTIIDTVVWFVTMLPAFAEDIVASIAFIPAPISYFVMISWNAIVLMGIIKFIF